MLDTNDLVYFREKSQCALKFEATDSGGLNIFNRFGERIAELDLSYVGQGIFRDTWYGFVANEEYVEIMSGVYLHYFKTNFCTKKICDTQLLKIGMDRGTSEWFVNVVLPELRSAGLKYNAIVTPWDMYARRSMDFFEENLNNNYAMMFPSSDIALLWLQSVS